MSFNKLLIANRGEIALRIARTANLLGIPTVAAYHKGEQDHPHVRLSEKSILLGDGGPASFLDRERWIEIAGQTGADAIHPGYGFLSESAAFAHDCQAAGIVFVGPDPSTLDLLGDKQRARELAIQAGLPVLPGSGALDGPADALKFWHKQPTGSHLMLKAAAGGGGRGMRVVRSEAELERAYAQAAGEARAAFGSEQLYAELLLPKARHIEVQILGDGAGNLMHLFDRDCSLQRRHQKLIELAPAPGLHPQTRAGLHAAALDLAKRSGLVGLGTFEFLVKRNGPGANVRAEFFFLEANPRLQVEHTITEQVLSLDLVALQLEVARGRSLRELGLDPADPPRPRGFAIELRINAEEVSHSGPISASEGIIQRINVPHGPTLRFDSHAHTGLQLTPMFDSLLGKLIVHVPTTDAAQAVAAADRLLAEISIEGVRTNLELLQAMLACSEVRTLEWHTTLLDQLIAARPTTIPSAAQSDPGTEMSDRSHVQAGINGLLLEILVGPGQRVHPQSVVAIVEAMKMQHEVTAGVAGTVSTLAAAPGQSVRSDTVLLELEPSTADQPAATAPAAENGEGQSSIRADLAEVNRRRALRFDESRPTAVNKRHKRGQRTARENIAALCDPDSFYEYGGFALAAQSNRRTLDDLLRLSPADGLVSGLASVNGNLFAADQARCAVLAYDYTVFTGTQGARNHKKTDRLFQLAQELHLPVFLFVEGSGGRPGDVDMPVVSGLDVPTFRQFAKLSGLVPRVAVVAGRCFAGNAALAGCSDVIIATRDSTMGMGGPVMIKGGGLGTYRAEEVGPAPVLAKAGVIDLLADDEAHAVQLARQVMTYFQGATPGEHAQVADQRLLRDIIPANRKRVYDMRQLLGILCDAGSVLELRAEFAPAMITAFARFNGRPVGLIANNPASQAGAIGPDEADKAARFLQLCDGFDLPVLSLCDTPGIMVGPDVEARGNVRHAARLFLTAASLQVPIFTIVVRRGYGLGAQAMAGGSFHAPVFTIAWPSGEFGAMGLEGAVRIGFERELAAVADWQERQELFEKLVRQAYEQGSAINVAVHLEIDDVIDPVDSRAWVLRGLDARPPQSRVSGRRRPMIDSW